MISVLYVDDEAELLEIAKLFLEQSGEIRVLTSPSAKQALDTPSLMSCDAIVSDYQMPGMDGIAFLKAVRQQNGEVPFILFTGRGREEVVIEAINNGADFYIQKGGDPTAQFAELAHKVRQAVGKRQAEQALRDSDRRLLDIIEFLPDATFAIDRSGRVIAWNRMMVEMTGIPPDEMVGKDDFEYAVPFYGVRRPILIDLALAHDREAEETYSYIRSEGGVVTAETTGAVLRGKQCVLWGKAARLYDSHGTITGAIESIRDITEKKQTEVALRESEEKYRALLDNSLDPIFSFNPDGTYRYVNRAFAEGVGKTVDQITGKRIWDVFEKEEAEQRFSALQAVFSTGVEKEIEVRVPRPGGDRYYVTSIVPVKDQNDAVVSVICSSKEITGRRKIEEALRRANRQLTLLTGITRHDILNKTLIILGYLEVIRTQVQDPALDRYLRKLESATEAIRSQIEFTRIYQDIGSRDPGWIRLDTIIPMLQVPEQVTLRADPGEVAVLADPMFEKVFFNLLENSLMHGQCVTEIRVWTAESDDGLTIVWEDNGKGIGPDDKERIFERGYGKNTGLGMFLGREILALTGITIRETGVPGKGARFEISVPGGAYRVLGDKARQE